jgi:soluble cytochrome b562
VVNFTRCFKAHSKIIDFQVTPQNQVIFTTTKSGIRCVSYGSWSTQWNILPSQLSPLTTATAMSPNGKLVAIVNSNVVSIMVLSSQKIIKTIFLEKEKVDVITFDSSSKYIILGTNTGRVLHYRYNSHNVLARLCSFPYYLPNEKYYRITNNFVSALCVHKEKLACSGYGGSITVIDLHTRANRQIIPRLRGRIETLVFLDDNTLLSGNTDGVLEVIDLQNPTKVQRVNAPFTKIKNIVSMPNKEYVLVSTDKNYLSLVNIATLKVINDRYMEFDAAIEKVVKKDDDSIFVVLQDATVLHSELTNIAKLRSLIDDGRLLHAYKLLANAPMLKGSHEHQRLDEKYKEKLQEAISFLVEGDKQSAKEITTPFMRLKAKQEEIAQIYEAFRHYKKFQEMFHLQRYSVAYSLCEKYPALKYTKEYKGMEKIWQITFLKAQKQMLQNNKESARVLLHDYLMVSSKRSIIKLILHNNQEFIRFLRALENKEYHKLKTLTKSNQILADMAKNQALFQEIQESLDEARELIAVGNIPLAKIVLEKLQNNPDYEDEVYGLYDLCKDVEQLVTLYEKKEYLACYTLIDTKVKLSTIELTKKLEQLWIKKIDKAERLALVGDIEGVKKFLGKLLFSQTRSAKTGDILRLAYRVKINQLLEQNLYKEAHKLIKEYTTFFGLDKEVRKSISEYVHKSSLKIQLTAQQAQRKPRDFWLYVKKV